MIYVSGKIYSYEQMLEICEKIDNAAVNGPPEEYEELAKKICF